MAKKTTLTGEVRALMNAAENIRGIMDKVNATAKRSNYPTGAQRETVTSAQELINNICRLANFIINPDATDFVDEIKERGEKLMDFDGAEVA